MKKRFLFIALASLSILTSCDQDTKETVTTTETIVETTTKETTTKTTTKTTEVVKPEVITANLKTKWDSFYHLDSMQQLDLKVDVSFSGKYEIAFNNDLDVSLNGEKVDLNDGKATIYLKKGDKAVFNIINNDSKEKMGYINIDVSTDTKDIVVNDNDYYIVNVKNSFYKMASFNNLKVAAYDRDYDLNKIEYYDSIPLHCEDGYLLIKNNTSEVLKGDLVLNDVESIDINESKVIPTNVNGGLVYKFECEEAGFYSIIYNTSSGQLFGWNTSALSYSMGNTVSFKKQEAHVYLKKGANCLISFEQNIYNDSIEESTVVVNKIDDIGELYINGKLYDGYFKIKRGEEIEIEYYKDGVSKISDISIDGDGTFSIEGDKIKYKANQDADINKIISVYIKNRTCRAIIGVFENFDILVENYTYSGQKGVKITMPNAYFNSNEHINCKGQFEYLGVGYDEVLDSLDEEGYYLSDNSYFFAVDQELFKKYGAKFHLLNVWFTTNYVDTYGKTSYSVNVLNEEMYITVE